MNNLQNEVREEVKSSILHYVAVNKGLKGGELFLRLLAEFYQVKEEHLTQIIHEMTQVGELKRIEYVIPENSSSIFTFYLPGTAKIL